LFRIIALPQGYAGVMFPACSGEVQCSKNVSLHSFLSNKELILAAHTHISFQKPEGLDSLSLHTQS